ncbi:MAG TPA: GAF domain-containing protein [Ignavibacteria bacterium]|nr:GAF domain-containing protein [Ignavibacteria bacterium]
MSFEIKSTHGLSKKEQYESILPQINSLIEGESNFLVNITNITSVIKYSFDNILWAGFYFIDKENQNELLIGPFQGRVPCTRIPIGNGVCGASAERKETIIVEDVGKFPGHIVCDSLSRSEIVVPVIKANKVIGVLDIDSELLNNFDETDKKYLEKLIENISHLF